MMQSLLQTDNDYVCLLLRIVAGIIIFPYGMQKLFGWFDDLGGGVGVKEVLEQLKRKHIPVFIGWLIIIAQSFGSIALILGCLGRVAALGNFIIFTGALIVHIPDGWSLDWLGKKKAGGVEYFVLLLSLLLVIMINGSGAWSIDYWFISRYLSE